MNAYIAQCCELGLENQLSPNRGKKNTSKVP